MAKSFNQKGKLINILHILEQKTDLNHRINTPTLISELEKLDISAERKSIYDDIQCLNDLGYDVECDKSRNGGYYLASRKLEKYELIPLVDAISSSRFITQKKSRELIKKLESLLSVYEAKELDREVYVSNRIKSDNESIYYMLDTIHNSLSLKQKINFKYCEYNLKKELVARKGGKLYEANPMALVWDDEKYYLIGYDDETGLIKHYRVDKMKDVSLKDEKITDTPVIREFDVVKYCNRTFGMYGGKDVEVTLKFPASMVGVCIDRFGKEPTIRPIDDGENFLVRVSVSVSAQFFGWITGLGSDVKIMAPESVAKQYKEFLQKTILNY